MFKKIGLSKVQILLLLGTAAFNFLIYIGARWLSADSVHHCLAVGLDEQIPFLPWTVLIYWGCLLFWVVNYYIGVKCDQGNGYRFILSHYIGEAICLLFFVFFPTTTARPEIAGNSVFDWIIKLTYQYDEANNLFPSIHCFVSWLSWIGVRSNKHIPGWYQILSFFMAVSVCISTLTVKQHVLVDVPAGILLAEVSYLLAKRLDRHDY